MSLSYPFAEAPSPGTTLEVAPGVYWIRMPMPFALSHINVWALADGDGWTLVDTGLSTKETGTAWCTLLKGPLAGKPVTRVFATHMHPDHIGLAGWLTRRYGVRLWMTRLEYLTCHLLAADVSRDAPAEALEFYHRCGWDSEALDIFKVRFGSYGKYISALPDSYRRVRDGEEIQIGEHRWQAVLTSGHSPEHLSLYCPELKLLISGDQVLPKISSNISVHPNEPDANPLSEWLASLEALKQRVSEDVLVLPAHGDCFHGLHQRLNDLALEHRDDLDRLREALATPQRTVDVFSALFSRPINNPDLLSMATGESLAHLNYLLARGEAAVERDADGVAWYRRV